jgi:hypothetical protein
VRQSRAWVHRPETQLITRAELGQYAPRTGTPNLRGDWIPDALWKWARHQTFYREPAGQGRAGELVTSLPVTVMLGGGDCDDIAAAQATMAAALGVPAAIGRLHPDPTNPAIAHIVCGVASDWTGADPWWIVDPQMRKPPNAAQVPGVRWFQV